MFDLTGHEVDWNSLCISHRGHLNMDDICIVGHAVTDANKRGEIRNFKSIKAYFVAGTVGGNTC